MLASELLRIASKAQAKDAWNILSTRDLATPLPPIPWLCEPIRLAPGAVTLVAGYGYSRKTMALQSLGLSVAVGRAVWGLFSCRKGRVVHLDYEQGERLTKERYQRLARGVGIEIGDLEPDALRVACMPRVYLETQDAIDSLLPYVDGAALVIVDSLRAAFPHADENSSDVRSYLDALNHLSGRTGATIIVIHHARKPSAQSGGTETHAIRGSSALFDACQTVYFFAADDETTPTTVKLRKDRVTGAKLADFGLMAEDTPGPTGLRHGLVVRHLEAEQMAQSSERTAAAKENAVVDRMAERIVRFLGERGGSYEGSKRSILDLIGGNEKVFRATWARLVDAGVILAGGTVKAPSWRLING
jgi:hypothetical protein